MECLLCDEKFFSIQKTQYICDLCTKNTYKNIKSFNPFGPEKSKCKNCNESFNSNRHDQKFCSNICANRYISRNRNSTYIILKSIECKNCNKFFTIRHYNQQCCSIICANKYKGKIRTFLIPIECKLCNKLFQPKRSTIRFCSANCVHKFSRLPENYERQRKQGSIGGKISAQNQCRRSKNEIYFYELCLELFPEAIHNEPIFDGWDADIILPNLKIAILWNGIWHYQKIREAHNLAQVQTRDKFKLKLINKYNYKAYIIKDMGKHNKKFVESEFQKFKDYVYFT